MVQIGNCRSHNHPIKEGSPQGAILSPILFNLYISEFKSKHASFGLFADDLVIWKSGRNVTDLVKDLQQDIHIISCFSEALGLSISTSKTKVILFTRQRHSTIPNIVVNNSTINYESSVKLLRIVFDSKLRWHDHIKSLKKNIIQKLTLLKRLANSKWSSSPKTMIDFYKVYIRAKIKKFI